MIHQDKNVKVETTFKQIVEFMNLTGWVTDAVMKGLKDITGEMKVKTFHTLQGYNATISEMPANITPDQVEEIHIHLADVVTTSEDGFNRPNDFVDVEIFDAEGFQINFNGDTDEWERR